MPGVTQGQLDRRISVLRAVPVANAFNEKIATFLPLASLWANVRDASANESYRAQEVGAEISTRFTIRWSSLSATIDARDRIAHDGREYNITAVRDVGRRLWREIDAGARQETGYQLADGSA